MRLLASILSSFILLLSLHLSAQTETNELKDFTEEKQAALDLSGKSSVQAPNTGIYMVPPENFETYPKTNGFIHNGSATIIQVLELENVSSESISETLNNNYFESQGFTLEGKDTLQLNNGETAFIYVLSYTVNNEAYERIMFFTGSDPGIWINVNYPAIVKALLYKPIIESLKTVHQ